MSRLRDKVVVPSMDEASARRVEQRVLAQIASVETHRPQPLAWLLSRVVPAAAIAAVAVLATMAWQDGRYTAPAPHVQVRPDLVTPEQPTTVATDDAGVTLELDGASLRVGPHARITLTRRGSLGTTVVLASGRVDCEVVPRDNRPPFIVEAGEVNVEVVGTVFAVDRTGDAVRVEVSRGKVQVSDAAGARAVAAGQAWSEQTGTVALAAAGSRPRSGGTARPGARDSVAVRSSARTRDRQNHRRPKSAVARSASVPQIAPDQGDASDQGTLGALPRPPRGASPADVASIRKHENSQPKKAASEYRHIAYSKTGNAASYAMYSLAYVQLFRLNLPAAAEKTAGQYGRRFPRGREAESALWLRVRALCKQGNLDGCRAAAHSYVGRYPSGRFAAAARRVINQ